MRIYASAMLGAFLISTAVFGAAWPAGKGELVITQTTLIDWYNYYARNSTNSKLLQDPGGSIVQAGHSRRFGFLLGAEYGIFERLSATVNFAFFYTEHVNVGENLRIFTNAVPNKQYGFQDFTGNLKYTLFQTEGSVLFALAPYVGWAIPLSNYDTSLDNPLGDGVITVEPGLAVSLMLPAGRFFANADFIYKFRGNERARVGGIFPVEIKQTVPNFPNDLVGGKIYDQVQFTAEAGYFITDWLSVRAVVRRIESLGGESLTFEQMPQIMSLGFQRMSMFENSLAYDQDALYVGGGLYVQLGRYFGIGATYVHAVWFKNFPNMKTLVISLSFNPQIVARQKEEQLRQLEELEAAEAAAAEPGAEPEADAPPPEGEASPAPASEAAPSTETTKP